MKIVIKTDGCYLRLWFPLSALKSRIGYSVAKSAIEQKIKNEIALSREQMVEAYNFLKQYVKTHGHFNLVEVQSHDGDKVIIRV